MALASLTMTVPPDVGGQGPSFIADLLADQQRTTAVEKFAQWHAEETSPLAATFYRELIPLSLPRAGEQYAFQVDLDACSGCQACVAACHNLNGLEADELWQSVGLLHGGTAELPVLQHVTSACHHCVEPACLEGCPVLAYEKDPVTGIVQHLDDQCIGCQYCILKCPYDVPKYSAKKGIVRKCDMCSDRLSAGEAPACVQACPHQAIRITVVNQQAVVEESEANLFLPGAPEPSYTLPTTIYKTSRPLPRNLLPADYYSSSPQHAHLALVWMLVLTQMSVGAFGIELARVAAWFGADGDSLAAARPWHGAAALLLGLVGMIAAVCHLGRPHYAWRAWLGLRTSWLSREILAFGLFAGLAASYAAMGWAGGGAMSPTLLHTLGAAAALAGLAGVACSVMIYVDTRRAYWSAPATCTKFFGSVLLLGLPTALIVSLAGAAFSEDLSVQDVMVTHGGRYCQWLMAASAAKLLAECLIFAHLRCKQHTPLKRTALLMTGELKRATAWRFLSGVAGGVLLPSLLVAQSAQTPAAGFAPAVVSGIVIAMLAALLVGEWLERYLFFRAVVAPKMPGSPAS